MISHVMKWRSHGRSCDGSGGHMIGHVMEVEVTW